MSSWCSKWASVLSNVNEKSTVCTSASSKPAASSRRSIVPGSEKANGPGSAGSGFSL
jgi:hypothetical protein